MGMTGLRRLAVYGAVIALAGTGVLVSPTPWMATEPAARMAEDVLFSIPIGPDGITYAGQLSEQRPWGPAAIVADEAGTLWIADTARKPDPGVARIMGGAEEVTFCPGR